jgi:hypothetical protein
MRFTVTALLKQEKTGEVRKVEGSHEYPHSVKSHYPFYQFLQKRRRRL